MKTIAAWVANVISGIDDTAIQQQIREEASHMCQRFPLPGIDD